MATETRRPIVQLLAAIVNEITGLMQTELRLVKAELNEKLSQLVGGGVMVGVSAVLLIASLGIAFLAIAEWLVVAGLPREWALTLPALAGLAIGSIIAMRGVKSIKATELVPKRSLRHVREDFNTIKDHVS
jgi:uncharacterized membrane protein YqjE